MKFINNFKKIFLLVCLISTAVSLQAQDVLFREDRESSPVDTLWGPNQPHYIHFLMGGGYIVGNPEGNVALRHRSSGEFTIGPVYKRRLNQYFSLGMAAAYRYTKFAIAQRDVPDFPDDVFGHDMVVHESEKFGFHAIPLSAFLRINVDGRRGNTIGHYLELGGSGEWVFTNEYVVENVLANKMERKTRYTNMPFVNPFQYHAYAKIGMRWLSLGVRYRISDYFKSSYGYPEFPRYSITAELNFVK